MQDNRDDAGFRLYDMEQRVAEMWVKEGPHAMENPSNGKTETEDSCLSS